VVDRDVEQSMTQHYRVAQIVEIHSALEQIKDDTGRWNKSLAMLRLSNKRVGVRPVPQKSPSKEERVRCRCI
jgi:hypothetical protein